MKKKIVWCRCWDGAAGCLNIKMSFYQYRDSHYKDKTASRLFYLCNGNLHTWNTVFMLKWDPGGWNFSLRKTGNNIYFTINIMADDVLATQWARASTAMGLTQLSLNIPFSVPDSLTPWPRKILMKLKVLNFPDNFSDWWLSYLWWTYP